MKNHYNYQYQSGRSNFSYSSKKKQETLRLKKYKLLIIILQKAVHESLKQSFYHLFKYTNQLAVKIKIINHAVELNSLFVLKLAFQKLKQNLIHQRHKQHLVKRINAFYINKQKIILKNTFSVISLYSYRKGNRLVITFIQNRRYLFCRRISTFIKNKKANYFHNFAQKLKNKKQTHKKTQLLTSIVSHIIKNSQRRFFLKIMKHFQKQKNIEITTKADSLDLQNKQSNDPKKCINSLSDQNDQIKKLYLEIEDMSVQLQNKNQSIQNLKQQLNEIKSSRINNHLNQLSQYYSQQSGLNKSRSKSIKRFNLNQSSDSHLDFSIGSILGASFTTLNKSRSKSLKKGQQSIISDCNCWWRQKSIKYKNTNQSLKNQLQIVKQQLEVAKDLNEHFTNQIRQYFNGDKNQIQMNRLRKQFQIIQKQRDQLKMKTVKYQHHIATLKSQFKIKIEDLYRKVKKQR